MKGVYALVIFIPDDIDVRIGALGTQRFEAGKWVYIGSAFGNGSTSLEHRIRRHFSHQKKLHWHIDLLMEVTGSPTHVIWSQSERKRECEIANRLGQHEDFTEGPKGFGSSDCKAKCGTHLFRHNERNTWMAIEQLFEEIGLEPQSLEDLS
ncbi:MAG: GIY-YIG nuclease family protein [Candidatus Thorarchaeota archaeon]|jgi:Uri superfamily endonuclease